MGLFIEFQTLSFQSYGANSSLSTSSSGPPPPSQQGYPVKSMGPQHPRPPGGAPMSYPGQRPPMYPGIYTYIYYLNSFRKNLMILS